VINEKADLQYGMYLISSKSTMLPDTETC